MSDLVVEFILVAENTKTICTDETALVKLLEVESSLSVTEGRLKHGSSSCLFSVKSGNVDGKAQRYFHLKFGIQLSHNNDEEEVTGFSSLLHVVRGTLNLLQLELVVLRDDVASYYGCKAYPIIEDIEKTMRQLIGHFMILKVGSKWESEAAPGDVRKVLGDDAKKRAASKSNPLYALDFIHLSQLLVKPYTLKPCDQLIAKIQKSSTPLSPADLSDYMPRSNWDRYFKDLVDCEDLYLDKRWSRLYDLRCLVAHSVGLNRNEYEELSKLITELRPKLNDALGKLPQVTVPTDEQDAVADNAASNVHKTYAAFLASWQVLEKLLDNFAGYKLNAPASSFSSNMARLKGDGAISEEDFRSIMHLRDTRSRIAHMTNDRPTPAEAEVYLNEVTDLVNVIESQIPASSS